MKLILMNKYSIFYLLLSFVFGFTTSWVPFSLKFLISSISSKENILTSIISFVVPALISIILMIYLNFIIEKIKISFEKSLKVNILNHYKNESYEKYKFNEFENDFLYNSMTLITGKYLAKLNIIYFSITTIISIAIMTYLSWFIMLISMFLNIIVIFLNIFLKKRKSLINVRYGKNRKDYMEKIENTLMGYDDTFALSKIKNLNKKFRYINKSYKIKNTIVGNNDVKITTLSNAINFLSGSITIILIFIFTYLNIIPVFVFIVFIGLNSIFKSNINGFISSIYTYSSSKGIEEKIFRKIKFNKLEKYKKIFPIKTNNLSFENLIYYKNTIINEGEKILLCGQNGSGKSIFLKSILSWVNFNGDISYNGKKYNSTTISKFTKYLSSNPVILDKSIKDNIFLLDEKKSLDFKEKHKFFFSKLPNINNNAQKLSHGQKQIVALLRALYFSPKILIIDEGFSGIAKALLQDLEHFISTIECSIIYVSHQKATNFKSDKKILLESNNEKF